MHRKRFFRGLLSMVLTVTLVLTLLPCPAWAEEVDTVSAETTIATEPPETTIQEETEARTPMTICEVKALPAGTEALFFRGTLVYSGNGVTVIQDDTAGICLNLQNGEQAPAGTVFEVTGTRIESGIKVTSMEEVNTVEDLSCREAAPENLEDCIRVELKNVDSSNDCLILGGETLTLFLPESVTLEEHCKVAVRGVKVGTCFYADWAEAARETADQEQENDQTQDLQKPKLEPPKIALSSSGEAVFLTSQEENVTLFYSLSYDGENYGEYREYPAGGIPIAAGETAVYIRAYGKKEGFLPSEEAEAYFAREADQTEGSSPEESAPEDAGQLNVYFGQLHTHTALSDGTGTVEEAFDGAIREGMDFFAITDHSEFFDNAMWEAGRAAGAKATTKDFVGIFGYEMTWKDPQYGHVNAFFTDSWESRDQLPAPEQFYEALSGEPRAICQINHQEAANDFLTRYVPKQDGKIMLMEVEGESGQKWYDRALSLGWHVAPANNQGRTGILAYGLTEDSLYDALKNRRVYATTDSDLEILYHINGEPMGSVIRGPAREITVSLGDPSDSPKDASGTLEVIGLVDGKSQTITSQPVYTAGEKVTIKLDVESPYYYLRVTQRDNDVAVTAPIWVEQTGDRVSAEWILPERDPIQGETAALALKVTNNESSDFKVNSVTCYLDGEPLQYGSALRDVRAFGEEDYEFNITCSEPGAITARAVISGTICGNTCSVEKSVTLYFQPRESAPLKSIREVRQGETGQLYRIQGYVTAGTSNPNNTFPGMLYLQDETGGIAVADFWEEGIQLGTGLEITGCRGEDNGNLVLNYVSHEQKQTYYNYEPKALYNSTAMDYKTYGGQLLQVEGTVQYLNRTNGGRGISRFTLKDTQGAVATVVIEEGITAAACGENRLSAKVKAGKQVRAIGILHMENGNPVIRVRNCEEVVTVDALADASNPKTREKIYLAGGLLAFSLSGLMGLYLIWRKQT